MPNSKLIETDIKVNNNNDKETEKSPQIIDKDIREKNDIINITEYNETEFNQNISEPQTTIEKKKSQTQIRDFDNNRLSIYPWLRCDAVTGLMTCKICIDFGKQISSQKDVTEREKMS